MNKWIKIGILASVLIGLTSCIVAVVAYDWLRKVEGETERDLTGYLAAVGHVPQTYGAVTEFLQREFPAGMSREEVWAKLSANYIYDVPGQGWSNWYDAQMLVVFPSKSCADGEDLKAGSCPAISFFFEFSKEDRLLEVKWFDS